MGRASSQTAEERSARAAWFARWVDREPSATTVDDPVVDWGFERQEPRPIFAHVHPDMEVGVVLEGTQLVYYGDLVLRCTPGDVWCAASGEVHGVQWTGRITNVCLAFCVEFLGDAKLGDQHWLSVFATPASARPRIVNPEQRALVSAAGVSIQQEVAARDPGWRDAVRIHLLEVLLTLTRHWDPAKIGEPPSRPGGHSEIYPALQLVCARYGMGEKVGLKEAADACAMSRSLFSRAFREVMGVPFGRFELRSRLGIAAHLLRASQLPIAQIAAQAGFWDSSHLLRHFLKHYGMRPRAFRMRALVRGRSG
jgi:AraC-like DNA-binding protein